MKVAFLCNLAHLTIIEKPEHLSGRIPATVTCSHIGCGCGSAMFPFNIDEEVKATHVFYNTPKLGEIVTLEEQNFLSAGGLMFREIVENVPEEVKREFVATAGIQKLALYIMKNFPFEEKLPDIIDTAIFYLQQFKGHQAVMKKMIVNRKNLN